MIRWTLAARADFESMRDYIARDSYAAAERQAQLILATVEQLKAFPLSGKKMRSKNQREIAVPNTPYVIGYRLSASDVVISRLWHGANRIPRYLPLS